MLPDGCLGAISIPIAKRGNQVSMVAAGAGAQIR